MAVLITLMPMALMAEFRFAVLVADAVLVVEVFVDALFMGLPLAAWTPLASTCHAILLLEVLFVTLALGAALSFSVLVLGFVVVAVLLGLVVMEPAALLLRAVAVEFMVVMCVALVDVKELNSSLPAS